MDDKGEAVEGHDHLRPKKVNIATKRQTNADTKPSQYPKG